MSGADLFVYGILLFGLSIVFLTGAMGVYQLSLNTAYVNHNYTSPDGNTTINPATSANNYVATFDWVFVFIAVIYGLAMMVSGYLIPSHPVFLIASIFGFIFWLLIAPAFTNTFLYAIQSTPLSSVASLFPYTTTLMVNLPIVGLFIGALVAILTHGKNPTQSGLQ